MNVITDTWRQLVRRKLWPVALLLLGALVAAPPMLAKDPETAPRASAAGAAKAPQGLPATFVSAAVQTDDAERRRVLGAQKDPFSPAELPKAVKKKADKAGTAATPTPEAPSSSSTSTAGGGTTSAPTAVPPVSAPAAPKKTYPLYSIKVSFGQVDGELQTQTLERLNALPSAESPVVVYLGVEDSGKTAVFMLTGDVIAQGDGACEPSPEDCQALRLKKGETEFIDVKNTGEETDFQYQLDLVTIHTETTTDAERAKASRAEASSLVDSG